MSLDFLVSLSLVIAKNFPRSREHCKLFHKITWPAKAWITLISAFISRLQGDRVELEDSDFNLPDK